MYKRYTQNFGVFSPRYTGAYDTPVITPYDGELPLRWIGFNEVKTYKGDCTSTGVHFFLDDYRFERVWRRPGVYINRLRKFALVAAPDFSLFMDFPRAMQIWNHYRKQWLAAYWQSYGVRVAPTVCWSDGESRTWCFDGVPTRATVLISAVGSGHSEAARRRFVYGYRAMQDRLRPRRVIAYGDLPDGCCADIVIPTHSERLRHRT